MNFCWVFVFAVPDAAATIISEKMEYAKVRFALRNNLSFLLISSYKQNFIRDNVDKIVNPL